MLRKIKEWLTGQGEQIASMTEEAVSSAIERGVLRAIAKIEDLDAGIVLTVTVEPKEVATSEKTAARKPGRPRKTAAKK